MTQEQEVNHERIRDHLELLSVIHKRNDPK